MGKKFFSILVVLILCLSLAACGQNNEQTTPQADNADNEQLEPKDPKGGYPGVIINDPDDIGGGVESGEDTTVITEGSYQHKIGNCEFYTDNDLDQWIDDGVFDFYGMLEYFGWVNDPDVSKDVGYWGRPGPDVGFEGSLIRLDDDGWADKYVAIVGEIKVSQSIWIEVTKSEKEMLAVSNGKKISYELCELLLYMMECVDKDPDYVTMYLDNMNKYLPDRVIINTEDR